MVAVIVPLISGFMAASPGSSPRSERGSLAQGNAPPSQSTGTSAQGYGPPGSMGQSCLPAHEDGHPHGSQGQGFPPAQGEGSFSSNNRDNCKQKPRSTTKDTKRMTNIIVHTMIDQCVDNQNIVFATTTTDTPPTDWSPPKKSGNSIPFSQRPYLHPKPLLHTLHTHTRDQQSSPLSLPAAGQLPRALADSPASNSAEPSTCPSPGAPSQQTPAPTDAPASTKSIKSPPAVRPKTNTPKKTKVEASTQRKQLSSRCKALPPNPLPPPPPPAAPPVIINNYAERAKPTQDIDEDGYTKVKSRNQRKRDREHQTPKPLKGADRPDTVYLYITSCHPDTNEEDIEEHLSEKFENMCQGP
ncbi:serine/arginine repetitive matrix protein 1-like [Penaeus vannamei]|uniref:serine/arginine repetitive matrix protein 1-like n=1 Tax=Penaeus vannamei TaxID=6689 RepID=UPI00387F6B8A